MAYRGLDFDAFIVDAEYYEKGCTFLDKQVLCADDVVGEDSVIICSIAGYSQMEQLKRKTYVVDEDVLSLSMVASDPFDRAFLEQQMGEFDWLYHALGDEKSRSVMTAYINQKLTGRFAEMQDVWDTIQYFDCDFYHLENVNCIVDCGAFIGDSYLSFRSEYQKRAGKEYNGIAYLLDPDKTNQERITENCKDYAFQINQLPMGAWKESGYLYFQSDEHMRTAGRIEASGDIKIQVNAIDDIVGENIVDFIKMDIEGAELNALKGAEKTIKRDKPILAICAYHKREDMIELSRYIQELNSDYKLYLRAYGGPYSIELVLYAVADNFMN